MTDSFPILTNVTPEILLRDYKLFDDDDNENNTWKNYESCYNEKFYKAILNIFKTGNIIYSSLDGFYTFKFIDSNYEDTTKYTRGKYNGEGILNAGDIITIKTEHFDFGIFVTEVIKNDKVLSRINSSIYEQPDDELINEVNSYYSTVIDTNGRKYSIRMDEDENTFKISNQIIPFINPNNSFLVPSNQSKYYTIHASNMKEMDIILNRNTLTYNKNYANPKLQKIESDLNEQSVIIPKISMFPIESENDKINNFDCNIRGFFTVHRSYKDNYNSLVNCLNFEIYFVNQIKYSNNILTLPFLICDNNENQVCLVNDENNSSCFYSGGGFYNDNQYIKDHDFKQNNLFEVIDFAIYSPVFFTKKLNQIESIDNEDIQNEMDELKQSIKSSVNEQPNERRCQIV